MKINCKRLNDTLSKKEKEKNSGAVVAAVVIQILKVPIHL